MVQGRVCLKTPETFYDYVLVVVLKQTQYLFGWYQNIVCHLKVNYSLLVYEVKKFS